MISVSTDGLQATIQWVKTCWKVTRRGTSAVKGGCRESAKI